MEKGDVLVSVIVPTYNEERYIRRCIASLLVQDGLPGEYEVLVFDGGSQDRTREIVLELAASDPRLKLYDNPDRIQVRAFNMGIRLARGEYIAFVGAHAEYASDYLANCLKVLLEYDAENVGGVQTAVGTTLLGRAVAWAMSSPFGVGGARFRFTQQEEEVDTVFGGFFRKSTLERLGGFDESCVVNEDYELNHRLRLSGGRIIVSPRIRFQYFVRSSLTGLSKQMFRYGFWRVRTQRKYPETFLKRHVAPPLLVALVLGSALLLWLGCGLGAAIPVSPYMVFLGVSTVTCLWQTKNPILALLSILVLPVMHISWGLGWWLGVFRFGFPNLAGLYQRRLSSDC